MTGLMSVPELSVGVYDDWPLYTEDLLRKAGSVTGEKESEWLSSILA